MPLTFTFHIGVFAVTIRIVKRQNRHPARWRFYFVRTQTL